MYYHCQSMTSLVCTQSPVALQCSDVPDLPWTTSILGQTRGPISVSVPHVLLAAVSDKT